MIRYPDGLLGDPKWQPPNGCHSDPAITQGPPSRLFSPFGAVVEKMTSTDVTRTKFNGEILGLDEDHCAWLSKSFENLLNFLLLGLGQLDHHVF